VLVIPPPQQRPATAAAGPGGQVAEEALFDLPPAELGLEEQEEDLFGLGETGHPHPRVATEPVSDSAGDSAHDSAASDRGDVAAPAARPRGLRGWLARLFGSES
jgi:hypothetical protein